MKVKHYSNPDAAVKEYDRCVSAAPNGNIYALSWYLNITCPDWEFLGTDDFSTVMPLPVYKSMGRKVIKLPEYTYQLGVYSTAIPGPQLVQDFLGAIPENYRIKKLCFNKFNVLKPSVSRLLSSSELDLIRPYALISSQYGSEAQNQLTKSEKAKLSYVGNISANDLLMFSYRLDAFNKQRLKPNQISTLRLITSNAIRFRAGKIAAAYDANNNLCAAIFFLNFNGRISIHLSAANSEGILNGAIYFILDSFIRENAGQNLVLCIDNPDSKRTSDIFRNFGSAISNYPCIKKHS